MKKLISAFVGTAIILSLITAASAASFTDVPDTNPYKTAISYCADQEYVKGLGNDIFNPDGELSRAQFASVWCRFLLLIDDNHSFDDVTMLNKYYETSVIVLRSLGILNGINSTHFSADGSVTREQLAVITMRTLDLRAASDDDYKAYTDHASVSDWAREGVSACVNADVFEDLFDGDEFEPQEAVTRGELCKLIYNIDVPKHDVNIDTLSGGAITARPTSARAGETVSLEVTPEQGMQLKAGSLKYDSTEITGNTFVMPAKDVLVTAEFEPVVLSSIAVTAGPATKTFTKGNTLNLDGLVVTATYSDSSTDDVTGYTTDPTNGATLDQAGTITVTVSYSEGGVDKTTTFDITVNDTV